MESYIDYFVNNWQTYLLLVWQHIYISLIAVGIAAGAGIPLGIFCLRFPRLKTFITTFFGALRIIPSLAILTILIPVMGIGVKPALVALTVLAIPPVLIQTVLGFAKVPDFMIEVAAAMGMDEKRSFYQVQFPLAMHGRHQDGGLGGDGQRGSGGLYWQRRSGRDHLQWNQHDEDRVSGDRRLFGCIADPGLQYGPG